MRIIQILLFFLLYSEQILAQIPNEPRCGNEAIFLDYILSDTVLANRIRQNEQIVQRFLSNPLNHSQWERQMLTIPVVVHIVWYSNVENVCDQMVFSQIETLNQDFSGSNPDILNVPSEFRSILANNIGLRFCLASISPDGNPTDGIVRIQTNKSQIGISDDLYRNDTGGSTAWDPEEYLNIWVANTGDAIAGFGTYPSLVPIERSGLVIHPRFFGITESGRYNLGRTAVHEIGHYLGLYHPWGDGHDCITDDGILDTPPQQHSYLGCPQYPQFSCDHSNTFMNYMDYVDDRCMVMFTQGQKEKMLAVLATLRPQLGHSSLACQPKNISLADDFTIYPNPTDGMLTVECPGPSTNVFYLIIFNVLGQVVKEAECFRTNGVGMQINIANLPTGLYAINLLSESGKIIGQKFIVRR